MTFELITLKIVPNVSILGKSKHLIGLGNLWAKIKHDLMGLTLILLLGDTLIIKVRCFELSYQDYIFCEELSISFLKHQTEFMNPYAIGSHHGIFYSSDKIHKIGVRFCEFSASFQRNQTHWNNRVLEHCSLKALSHFTVWSQRVQNVW